MATRIKLPSGVEATRASNGRDRGFRFEIPAHGPDFHLVTLSEADVAKLAAHLPLCDRCASFRADCICDSTTEQALRVTRHEPAFPARDDE